MPVFCLDGFREPAKVTVTVTSPSAPEIRHIRLQQLAGIPWLIPAGSPAGHYRVRATQGGRSATAEFEVRRATRPRMWITPDDAEPGELGGPPGSVFWVQS
ncbi:hypothetical protein SAMN05421748_105119 [Paractinoplanes atraurantiacus]|uniref:Uncharacterized protein n=2 Tax=Paractinoplanes atraurantiacus TaxID=1036182 RepID=A0A285HPB4_9ACTN|nr:hypothetical protein SAMN05421748_105119 [Actinoplanes atraurantiacus]